MSEENKRVLRRFFGEVWSEGNLDLIDEILARDCAGLAAHSAFSGRAELRALVAARRRAYPDLQVTVEDQIAQGDKVATRWAARGTRQDAQATGRTDTWDGVTLARLANGKMIEEWTIVTDVGRPRPADAGGEAGRKGRTPDEQANPSL